MIVNLLSFTNYKLKVNLYLKKNMDFFSYLLLRIITKTEKEERTLKEILLDFEITEPIMYLVESSLYNLIDNKLIECPDDLEKAIHKDIKIKDIAYKCLENKYILEFEQTFIKEICLDPLNKKRVTQKDDFIENYLIVDKVFSQQELTKFISEDSNYEYEVEVLEANPLITTTNIKDYPKLEINADLEETIKNNIQFIQKEAKTNYSSDLVILTKEYQVEKDDKYDFIATINNSKYGCLYYEINSNLGKIPMIKKTKIK